MKVLSTRVDGDVYNEFQKKCQSNGLDISDLLRRVIYEYMGRSSQYGDFLKPYVDADLQGKGDMDAFRNQILENTNLNNACGTLNEKFKATANMIENVMIIIEKRGFGRRQGKDFDALDFLRKDLPQIHSSEGSPGKTTESGEPSEEFMKWFEQRAVNKVI